MARTKMDVLQAVAEGRGALGKAAMDEPVFVLRAQDIHAADLVEKWAIWAAAGGCDPGRDGRRRSRRPSGRRSPARARRRRRAGPT